MSSGADVVDMGEREGSIRLVLWEYFIDHINLSALLLRALMESLRGLELLVGVVSASLFEHPARCLCNASYPFCFLTPLYIYYLIRRDYIGSSTR